MTFEDREISGASIVNRLGFLSLIRAAKARLFDVIVAKGLDRLFRDQADYHTARKRFDFLGITIDESEAEIVRRIFREFVEGMTPRAIAAALNAHRSKGTPAAPDGMPRP